MTFHAPLDVPGDLPRSEQVAHLTQAWVDVLAAGIGEHPEDWHMLQKVFVPDLDPARYAAALARATAGESGPAA